MRLIAVATILAVTALGACKQETPAAPTVTTETEPGVTLSDGQLRLPAVKGNPGAAYFTVANTAASGTISISAIAIAGAAKAEMHETKDGAMRMVDRVDVEAGSTVKFAPGGLHVMAFDLDHTLTAGGASILTATFADGSTAAVPLKLVAAGGVDHGAGH